VQPGSSAPIQNLCLTLPAYNEAAVIIPLLEQASAVLPTLGIPWSIIVVDDGSRDDTAKLVEDYIRQGHPQVQLARHAQNRGLGPAIITGLWAALEGGRGTERMIVCMDADLTHPPSFVPLMKRKLEAGADLVIASRFQSGSRQCGVPPFRRLLSVAACILFRGYLHLPGVLDYTCGFRAFRASLLAAGFDRFGREGLITRSGFACTDELLVHLATLAPVIREVPFTLRYDLKVGRSKMNLGLTVVETIKLLHAHRALIRRHGPK
jgi:dolichol-phosphate mannosyltransferase